MSRYVALIVLAGTAAPALAQLSYSGGTYSQNFDSLPTTGNFTVTGRGPFDLGAGFGGVGGVNGWLGAQFDGSGANSELRAQDGSLAGSAGRGIVSFGSAGSTDRALGGLATSAQISSFGLAIRNDSADTLTQFSLSYFGEQWRRGNVDPGNELIFSYGLTNTLFDITPANPFTEVTSLGFVAPNGQAAPTEVALDGNAALNRSLVSGTVTGLNWTPGSTLVIQWNVIDLSGQDDALAIDDLSFSAAVPAPGAAMTLVGALGLIARRRRR